MSERDGATRIVEERQRQLAKLGWSAKHDDVEHADGELALVAALYAASASGELLYARRDFANGLSFCDAFPWSTGGRGSPCEDARPYDGNVLREATEEESIRLLEKAGALCAAEIDRLLRKRGKSPSTG